MSIINKLSIHAINRVVNVLCKSLPFKTANLIGTIVNNIIKHVINI